VTRATGEALAASGLCALRVTGDSAAWDPRALAAIPGGVKVELETYALAPAILAMQRLPATSVAVSRLDDDDVRALGRAPAIRTLRVRRLDATSLAPLAEHPSLVELRFDVAANLAALDRVPRARFLARTDAADTLNRLVLCRAPITSIRGIGRLAGIEHLDLRGCPGWRRSMASSSWPSCARSISATCRHSSMSPPSRVRRACGRSCSTMRTAFPTGSSPAPVRPLVRRDHLRGLVNRLPPP
jgi:hypothetical protein